MNKPHNIIRVHSIEFYLNPDPSPADLSATHQLPSGEGRNYATNVYLNSDLTSAAIHY